MRVFVFIFFGIGAMLLIPYGLKNIKSGIKRKIDSEKDSFSFLSFNRMNRFTPTEQIIHGIVPFLGGAFSAWMFIRLVRALN